MMRPIKHFALVVLFAFAAAAQPPDIALVYNSEQMAALQEGKKDPLALYRAAIEDHGGRVVVFSPTCDPAEIAARKQEIHGVLLPGGVDVDPAFYGEAPHEKLEKVDLPLDRLEFALLEHARAESLPVLGICRGHQLLNVFLGGSLYQDIPAQFAPKDGVAVTHRGGTKRHEISIEEGALLYALLGVLRLDVNTYHHQAVKKLGEGLRVSARSDDGVVEAIERQGDVFIVGVQFHPERMRAQEPRVDALFARFIEESRARMRRNTPGDAEGEPRDAPAVP